jgi:hypothetical protein
MSKHVNVITYATYENVILDENQIKDLLYSKIQLFDPIESICFSSFLNMICQTKPIEELIKIQFKELPCLPEQYLRKAYNQRQILFHRDTLLFYISEVISQKVAGTQRITGNASNIDNIHNFGYCLLLCNSIINYTKYDFFERELIKTYPYHFPNSLYWNFYHRIIRYTIIYKRLFNQLEKHKKDLLCQGMEILYEQYGIEIDDLMDTIKKLFNWYLGLNNNFERRNTPVSEQTNTFNYKNISSFYIQGEIFKDDMKFLKCIDILSKDINDFYNAFETERKDTVDNDTFKNIQCFFDYPIFKYDNQNYCIIDFKFLIENICSGLFWRIKSLIDNSGAKLNCSMNKLWEQNGYLLESYFEFLLKGMFGDKIMITRNDNDSPDAILKIKIDDKEYIVIFEFTCKNIEYHLYIIAPN